MEKMVTAGMLGVVALVGVEIDGGTHGPQRPFPGAGSEHASPFQLPDARGSLRNLLLNAFGAGQPGPGEVRIPIPTEDAMYEVIVAKPGLPRSVPVAKSDADQAR